MAMDVITIQWTFAEGLSSEQSGASSGGGGAAWRSRRGAVGAVAMI